jgi:hypothetical protein
MSPKFRASDIKHETPARFQACTDCVGRANQESCRDVVTLIVMTSLFSKSWTEKSQRALARSERQRASVG